jgi:hypothetical protein
MSRRARYLVGATVFTAVLLSLLFVLRVLYALGENAVLTQLERIASPYFLKVYAYAITDTLTFTMAAALLAILAVLMIDALMSRGSAEIVLQQTAQKQLRGPVARPGVSYDNVFLFFENISRHVGDQSVAEDVTAKMTFWGNCVQARKAVVFGMWNVADAIAAVSPQEIPSKTWTFFPNHELGKLYVASKKEGSGQAIINCQETYKMLDEEAESWGWQLVPPLVLSYGQCVVRIELRGLRAKFACYALIGHRDDGLTIEAIGRVAALWRRVRFLLSARREASRSEPIA